ncbi:lysylphosphatidylglycerol synthase transmembrane domain-containing protein [Paenibacillus sp. YIM B09110]|uniref:lysylphosphatidylglycerol synthase transmembrane domain-containing protein n=1 Tax=Paenibacillus sp. YIM B09110 TaxID=3126102 RepID=UPI00301B7BB3
MRGKAFTGLFGIALFIVFLLLSSQLFDSDHLLGRLRVIIVQPGWIMFMFVAYLLSFLLKAAAWRAYAGREHPIGLYLHGMFYSLLINHLLPIKAGDLVRTGILMKKTSMRWDNALHSVVIMRLADMLVLGVISGLGMLWLGMTMSWLAVAAAAAALLAAGAALRFTPMRRWTFAERHITQLKAIVLSRQGPYILSLIAASWVLEAAILFGIAHMGGIEIGAVASVWANSVTIGGQIFHVTPGGIGTYESTLSSSLAVLGVSWDEAYATALLAHAFKFAFSFIVGAYSLVRMPIGLREARDWLRMPRKSNLHTNSTSERTF